MRSGTWSDPANWDGGDVAGAPGDSVDFSSVNLTGDYTVTLDSNRTVGGLVFGDISGTTKHQWIFSGISNSVLSLVVFSGSPTLTLSDEGPGVNVNLALPIMGYQGFTKAGPNTLTLSVSNLYSGTTVVAAGLLDVQSDGGLGSGDVQVADGASLTLESGAANNYINDSANLILNGPGLGQFVVHRHAGHDCRPFLRRRRDVRGGGNVGRDGLRREPH